VSSHLLPSLHLLVLVVWPSRPVPPSRVLRAVGFWSVAAAGWRLELRRCSVCRFVCVACLGDGRALEEGFEHLIGMYGVGFLVMPPWWPDG
jgi:hypothetical protein